MKIEDIRELTDAEIEARIGEEQDTLTRLRFNHAISEIENPAKIRLARKTIARLNTVVTERKMASEKTEDK